MILLLLSSAKSFDIQAMGVNADRRKRMAPSQNAPTIEEEAGDQRRGA
jgi:hypothetical protein